MSKSQNPIMKINFSHTDSFAGSVSHRPQSNLCQFGRGSDVEGCSDSHFHAWNIFDTCRIPIDSCAGGRLLGRGRWWGLWKIRVWIRSVSGSGFRFPFPEKGFPGVFYAACVGIREIFDSYFNEIMQAHFHTFTHSKGLGERRVVLACSWFESFRSGPFTPYVG